jgi:D-xylose transport system permease protein
MSAGGSPTASPIDPRLIQVAPGWRGALAALPRAELGAAPVLLGLIVIATVFQLANDRFLSPVNLTNLVLQIAAMGTLSVGIVLVLLLGEIDLSAGAVSGLAAAVMAILKVKLGWHAGAALGAALATGAAVGFFHGMWISRLKIPSFVVTLAGLLGWQGALLLVLGDTGSVNLYDPWISGLTSTFFSPNVGWAVGGVAIALAAVASWRSRAQRQKAGLPLGSVWIEIFRLAALAGAITAALAVFAQDRGLPLAALLFVGLVVATDWVLTRTRFGRHLFAVGGNAEAARRAGIRVEWIRTAVFVLGSTFAAAGGILAASRLLAVNQSSGSGDVLLNAIAAAVIGGTSLFGGRGSARSALLGALVIGAISNGMDLLAFASSVKFLITGAVLLVAASIDALSRRGRPARR